MVRTNSIIGGLILAVALFCQSSVSAAPLRANAPPVFATATNDYGQMDRGPTILFQSDEESNVTTMLDHLHTYIGGAVGSAVYGPFEQTGARFTGYYWLGVEVLRPVSGVRFILAYHNLRYPGADVSGQGGKLIMANKLNDVRGVWFLLGGGFLTDMAASLTDQPGSALGVSVDTETKNAFVFDIGFAYEVSKYTTAGFMVTIIDHDELGLSLLMNGDKSSGLEDANRMSVNLTFFAAAVDLEDLIF